MDEETNRQTKDHHKNALDSLVKHYLTSLSQSYNSLQDSQERQRYVDNLRTVSDWFQIGYYVEIEKIRWHHKPDTASLFDGLKARKIRCERGMNQIKLAETIISKAGLKKKILSCQTTLCRFELGNSIPNPHDNRRKFDITYLMWLKEQGYNPFNL